MPSASMNVSTNSETECSTIFGWSAICAAYAIRELRLHLRDGGLQRLAELDDVALVGHHEAEHQYLLAVVTNRVLRRVLVAAFDRRDVAEPEDAAIDLHGHCGDRIDARERAGDAQVDAVG
jgi:hypothetical protein